ncbi:MAG: response regulator [Eubacterium sp.]|nr:response regulator [Eubacterium sp.]
MSASKNQTPAESQSRSGSVLDEYSNKVFKLVVLIVPFFFICGNTAMTVLHYMGLYPAVQDVAMWCSNAIDIIYVIIAVRLVKTSYGPDGRLIPKKLMTAKYVLLVMVVLQWNLNSYICPFSDFWAYAPLFVIVQSFFFDVKMVRLSTILIVVSMLISWFINGENLLPPDNDFFYLNLAFRGIGLTFTLLSINIVTWFGKVFIIEVVLSREKEREMREKSYEYEREARVKSDFLANMSHEIRTPMNAVIGMAEIAMRDELPPSAMDCLAQIQKSGRNLLNIINDILDYSKIESGKMEIIQERYEPFRELKDISNILATRVGDKNILLYFVIDTKTPRLLLGDAMRIRQILINLANNAIKFTQKGSVCVTVDCEYADEDTVNLTYHIKDTGIGIKKDDMDKLFVSFQQVDSRRNRSVEGTGLGLAISQRLVEAMGGSIGVDSVYGQGSDFYFTIPQTVLDSSVELVVNDADRKRAIIMDKSQKRIDFFTKETERLGVKSDVIDDLSEYRMIPDCSDYIFFNYSNYDSNVLEFLERNPEITGVVIIDFNYDYTSDLGNLYILRRPVSTRKIVKVLNDEMDDVEMKSDNEAYIINFTAPTANILIVDDNAINITIAKGLLAPIKMNIDSAVSGPEAINKIRKKSYDIVLMDHMMPGMDGVDATKIIRETIPGTDDLVIIALSANAIEEARNMFLKSGMNDFVAKPIEIRELVEKIKIWLPDEKIEYADTSDIPVQEELPDTLDEFDMVDADRAAEALGSPELFRMIAEEYFKSGQETYDSIMESYTNEDYKNYTIRVHALKSSSRQIGAFDLGDMAEALELAGKSNDTDYIKSNTDDLLSKFRRLLDDLAPIFPGSETGTESDDLPLLSDDSLHEILNILRAACDDMDIDSMEEVGKELKNYAWSPEVSDSLTKLCEAIDRMEIITCEEILDEITE